MSGSGGFCSLECGAKVVAWTQVIGSALSAFFWICVLIIAFYASPVPLDIEPTPTTNFTNVELQYKTLVRDEEVSYHLAIFFLIIIVLFCFLVLGLACLLLVGIYKVRMNYVKGWLVVKGILLVLATGWLLIRLFGLLLGTDSDLLYSIIWIVVDAVEVWVVYNFWEEKKGEYVQP